MIKTLKIKTSNFLKKQKNGLPAATENPQDRPPWVLQLRPGAAKSINRENKYIKKMTPLSKVSLSSLELSKVKKKNKGKTQKDHDISEDLNRIPEQIFIRT